MARVVDHRADRIAVDAGEADDARASVVRGDLEERVAVEHRVEDRSRVVGLVLLARDGGQQRRLPAPRVVVGVAAGRHLPDAVRQVAQELLEHREGFFFRVGEVVDHAAAEHLGALVAEILLRDVDAERGLDHRGTAREHLARAPHHHVEVGEAGFHRRQPGHRTEHRGDDGDPAEQVFDARRRGVRRDVGASDLLEGLDAAAGRVEESHVRQAPAERQLLGVAALVADRGVGGAAAHGEVAAVQHRPAAVQAGEADDPVGGPHVLELVAVVAGHAGELADLLERTLVSEHVETLPDRQLAAAVLLRDAGFAAHLPGELAAPPQFLDFSLPDHGCSPGPIRSAGKDGTLAGC